MNIAFIGIRVDYRTTLSAPKRIANKLYEEIKKLNKDTFFYSLPWDSEGITQEDAKNGETVGSLSGIRDFILKNKIQTVYLSRYYSKLALYMVLLKKIYKFKLIYTVHGLIKKESDINGTFKGYGGMVERLLLNNCDGIAAVSEEAKEEILKYYPHLDPSIIEVINNGVEIPEDYEGEELPEDINIDESKPLILSIGIRAIKNTETIIESFINNEALYNSAQLLLIGDKEESYARDIVNKYKDYENVKFMDYVEPKYLNAIYKKSSLYVQISLFETFGVSIIEALLHKKQVVISSKLPIADYFTQEEVIFYNPEEDNLDLLMLKGLENSKEANTLGFKKAGDLFNWDRVSDKYYAFFKKICEEKK